MKKVILIIFLISLFYKFLSYNSEDPKDDSFQNKTHNSFSSSSTSNGYQLEDSHNNNYNSHYIGNYDNDTDNETYQTNSDFKYEYRTGTSGDYLYNYDINGSDEYGYDVNGNVDMNGKYGSGTVEDSDGYERDVEVEWVSYGVLEAIDEDGNTYELFVDE